jgi:hypothetical protein
MSQTPRDAADARGPVIARYLRALARLALVPIPEYLLVGALGGRATALVTGGVAACAVLAGALLWLLGG